VESRKLKVESNKWKIASGKLKVKSEKFQVKRFERLGMKFGLIILFLSTFYFPLSTDSFAQFGGEHAHIKASLTNKDTIHPGSEVKVNVKVSVNPGWHINSNKPNEDFLIPSKLTASSPEKISFRSVVYPKGKEIKFDFSEKLLSVYENEVELTAALKIPAELSEGKYKVAVTLEYQACNSQTCMPPNNATDTLTVLVSGKAIALAADTSATSVKTELTSFETPKGANTQNDDSIFSTLDKSGLLLSLIFVFLGGLALNLTPCVYPLIPITVGYFGGQAEGKTSKLVMMGLLYVLGMALTYSVIGVVTALSGAVFGALLQNTFVILFIALIFIVLSLSMFGVYEFQLPNWLVMKAGGAKGGLFGAFFMGLTMGIVAAPCIGPFVLGLVTYVAAKADVFTGFLLFFVLALGLGLPYFLLAIFSGKIKKLPKAGEWMEAVKHIFGLLLLGMAAYFVSPILPKEVAYYLLPVFGIIAALYLLFVDKLANRLMGFRIFKTLFALVIFALSVFALIPSEKKSIEWQTFSEEKIASAKTEGKPVIIDFYADWCIPCKELDAITFSNAKVIEESKRFSGLKADMTKSVSDEVDALRTKFKIIGVPTTILIDSKGNEVHRFTGFIKADVFLESLKEVK
jgi:thiol:disulfide interchange protein DsbD